LPEGKPHGAAVLISYRRQPAARPCPLLRGRKVRPRPPADPVSAPSSSPSGRGCRDRLTRFPALAGLQPNQASLLVVVNASGRWKGLKPLTSGGLPFELAGLTRSQVWVPKTRPCRSSCMCVLVEDAGESVLSPDVEVIQSARICDR
jgi:hypothetical protein